VRTVDWSDRITEDPAVQGGRPVIRGTRVAVQIIVGSLAGGMTVEEVCEQYRVTDEQVRAALEYAAEAVADRRIVMVT
jgi:uncharacterized protein (DUF433 family)